VAVTVALESLLKARVYTPKFTEVAPAVTVTDGGSLRLELVLDKVKLAPPLGAG